MSDTDRWEKGPRLIARGQKARHDPTWVEDILSSRPGRKPDAQAERQLLQLMASVKPENLKGVNVYSGDIDPRQLYRDIRANPRTSLLGKGVGHIAHLPLLLARSGDMRPGGPFYDPFSDSVYSPWDAPAATMHELGHAIDFNRGPIPKSWLGRQAKGLTRDAYTLAPFSTLIKEHRAWNEGREAFEEGAARKGKSWKDVKRVIASEAHSKYPALGSYWGGAAGLLGAAGTLYAATQQEDNTRGNLLARLALVPLLAGPLLGLGAGTLMRNRKEKELVAQGKSRYLKRREDYHQGAYPPTWQKAAMTMSQDEIDQYNSMLRSDREIAESNYNDATYEQQAQAQQNVNAEIKRQAELPWYKGLGESVGQVLKDPEAFPSQMANMLGDSVPWLGIGAAPAAQAAVKAPGFWAGAGRAALAPARAIGSAFRGAIGNAAGLGLMGEHVINSYGRSYIDPIMKAKALQQQLAGGTPAEILAQMDPEEVKKQKWDEGKIKNLQSKSLKDLAWDYGRDGGENIVSQALPPLYGFARDYLPDSWTAGTPGKSVPTQHLHSATNWTSGTLEAQRLAQEEIAGNDPLSAGRRGLLAGMWAIPQGVGNSTNRAVDRAQPANWSMKPDTKTVMTPIEGGAYVPQTFTAGPYRSLFHTSPGMQAYHAEQVDDIRFKQAPGTAGAKRLQVHPKSGLPVWPRETQSLAPVGRPWEKDEKGNPIQPYRQISPNIRIGKDQHGRSQTQWRNPAYNDVPGKIPEYLPYDPTKKPPVYGKP